MTVVQLADLPVRVLDLVETHVGRVTSVETVDAGSVRDLAATLHTESGAIFCKGIRDDAPFAWTLRNEAKVNPWLPRALAPALRFNIEAEGWLLVGFDHVTGRHPDLSPGSPDLARVAATLSRLAIELARAR